MPTDAELRGMAVAMQAKIAGHLGKVLPELESVADAIEASAGKGGNRVAAMLGVVLAALCQAYGTVNIRKILFDIARNEQFWRMQIAEEAIRPRQ